MNDELWLARLKAAYDGGLYKTEEAVGNQEFFHFDDPKTCGDCPYLKLGTCTVHQKGRLASDIVCDEYGNSKAIERIIKEREGANWGQWSRWTGIKYGFGYDWGIL